MPLLGDPLAVAKPEAPETAVPVARRMVLVPDAPVVRTTVADAVPEAERVLVFDADAEPEEEEERKEQDVSLSVR